MNNAYYEMLALVQQQTAEVIRGNIKINAMIEVNEPMLSSSKFSIDGMEKRTTTIKLRKRPCF